MSGTILCLDDHEIVQVGLETLVRDHFPGWGFRAYPSCTRFREEVPLGGKLILIADIQLPDGSGLDTGVQWKSSSQDRIVIVYSHKSILEINSHPLYRAIDGFISKMEPVSRIKTLLEKLEPNLFQRSEETLSSKEIKVFQLICKGYAQKEIASKLQVSLRTVETHRTNINRKIGKKNIAELVSYALEKGIYRPRAKESTL